MAIRRQHTYAAMMLHRILSAAEGPTPELSTLELDYEGTLAELRRRSTTLPPGPAEAIRVFLRSVQALQE